MSYAITEQQADTLSRFTCERLSSDPGNKKLIQDFISEKGQGVLTSLKTRGWISDQKGTIAYYLVKDPDGRAVFYFALRCGLLCEPGYVDRIQELLDYSVALQQTVSGAERGDQQCMERLRRERERLGSARYFSLLEELDELVEQKSDILRDVKLDKKLLPDQDVLRVDEAHAAVELVEMCVNDAARGSWKKWGLGEKGMGTTLFWQFVVSRMLQLSELAGCEFAYLFAAGERDGSLVRYYHEKLHFTEPKHLAAVKPAFDSQCLLMCKKLFTNKIGLAGPLGCLEIDPDFNGLDNHRRMYFDTFNAPANS